MSQVTVEFTVNGATVVCTANGSQIEDVVMQAREAAFKAGGSRPVAEDVASLDEQFDGMALYRCHKTVNAFKIAAIRHHDSGNATLYSGDGRHVLIVGAEYVRKHAPRIGGYYVLYADDYESFSPAEAFEAGYTRIA